MRHLVTDEEARLEPEEPETIATCAECGNEIFSGEIYGKDDMGRDVCRDCLNEEWGRLADDEKFELLGYEVVV